MELTTPPTTTTSSQDYKEEEEVLVCQTCGDQGFTNAFVYCVKCLGFVIHRYCLDVIPKTSNAIVVWLCEDCRPAASYKFTLLERDPSRPHKEDPTNTALVKTTQPKKKLKKKPKRRQKKKRKLVPPLLAAGKDEVSCPDSGRNQLTQCVVLGLSKGDFQKQSSLENCCPLKESGLPKPVKATPPRKRQKRLKKKAKKKKKIIPKEATVTWCIEKQKRSSESAELDNYCCPFKESAKRKRDETCLATETKKQKTEKTANLVVHSSCDSSCTDATLKDDKKESTHSAEEKKFEVKQLEELKKISKDNDGKVETANHMQNEQNRDGADGSRSAHTENDAQYIHHIPARPVRDPVWRGSFSIIETDYEIFEGLVGHLSSKACYKVCEEATTLPLSLNLQMQSKTDLWPKSFLESLPSDENIALYFFPGNTKNRRGFEQLVSDMIDEDLAMRASAKNAELLIFTSRLLPQPFWRFLGNYYLWGVFRGKKKECSLPVVVDTAVSNGSSDNCSRIEITSEKENLTKLKTIDSGSPQTQTPLCNYR